MLHIRVPAVLLLSLLAFPPARAADPPALLSAAELADSIDEHISRAWKGQAVVPAPRADDAELSRRLHLDLTGRIPDILAARDFLENPAASKRDKLIDRLLADDRHALHFANVYRAWLLPDSEGSEAASLRGPFETWLREQIKNNASWAQMVRALMTSSEGETGVGTFVGARNDSPDKLAAASSRLFLGVKLECAQCHNHPFAAWSRKQFWQFAAFFAPVRREGGPRGQLIPAGQIRIPGTERTVTAHFLDGKPAPNGSLRAALAEWITAGDNPYFARAAVNRLWDYFLGVGLVEPVDDLREDNSASHPELLALLAKQFAAHDFNLRYLTRAIVGSKTYQRTSRRTHLSQADARRFSRMKVRGLSPEQLFDSLALATGQKDDPAVNPSRNVDFLNPRDDFLRRFPNHDRRSEQQTSILQALYLMNGKLVCEAVSLQHNQNLALIARATSVPPPRQVEQLFLLTLARKPTPAESARLSRYIEKGGPDRNPAQALCDVFWVLLNTGEFSVNH